MIRVTIIKNKDGVVCGATVVGHDKSVVCAAVSMLVLNTVNSLTEFTNTRVVCEYKKKGGYISFCLPRLLAGESVPDAEILLKAMNLGIKGARDEHPNGITVTEILGGVT